MYLFVVTDYSAISIVALKLFSKYVHKSNRSMIINALQYSVFPGSVWDKQRTEVGFLVSKLR